MAKPKLIKKLVKIQLTEKRNAELAKVLGAAAQSMGEIKIAKAGTDSEYKNQLKEHELVFARAVTAINDGFEEKECECVEVKNFKTETVEYMFEGLVVESRPMTDDDRQGDLLTMPQPKTFKKNAAKEKADHDLKAVMKAETNKKTKRDASVG